jgi:hypothetical protein
VTITKKRYKVFRILEWHNRKVAGSSNFPIPERMAETACEGEQTMETELSRKNRLCWLDAVNLAK